MGTVAPIEPTGEVKPVVHRVAKAAGDPEAVEGQMVSGVQLRLQVPHPVETTEQVILRPVQVGITIVPTVQVIRAEVPSRVRPCSEVIPGREVLGDRIAPPELDVFLSDRV